MTAYILKSAIAMAVLLGVYYLFLEREKMHRFNRFYLLGSLAFSLVVPFVSIPIYVEAAPVAMPQYASLDAMPQAMPAPAPEVNYWLYTAIACYALVTLILTIRFARNILKFYSLKRHNTVAEYNGATLVLLDDDVLPHTFLNNIYLSKKEYEHRLIEPELLTHELAHVRQRHTIDILFAELLKTVFWFNPLPWLYKRAIQMNHEFLADESTIENHDLNIPTYQQMLLDKATPYTAYTLASSINFSTTKKRFIMMTKTTSARKRTLLQAMILPVLAITSFMLCYEVVAQTPPQNPSPGKDRTVHGERDVTKQEVDSLKKAEPGKYTSNDPGDYIRMIATYTNAKGKRVSEKSFYESKIPKDFAGYGYKWPDSDKIKAINIYKYTKAQNDSLKKLRPELYTYYDTSLSRMHLTYENDKGKIVEEDLFIDNINDDGTKRIRVVDNKPIITNPRPMVVVLPDEDPVHSGGEVQVQPEYPGGIEAFYKYVNGKFKVPETKEDMTARIYVTFVVEKDGSISNIKLLRDPGYGMGDQVVELLKGMTEKWTPGKIKGKTVRTSYSLPITINIKN